MLPRHTYGTYGDLTGNSKAIFLFSGRDGVQTDSNSLYYMRTRYYSATLKRVVNAGVRKGNIQTSESLNRYAYANGNPVNLVDPFGTSSEPGNNTAATVAHTALDIAGFISVVGTVTNIASGIWYASEGDYLAMGLSFASAIPIAGDITDGIKVGADAVKIGGTAVKGAEDASEIAKAAETFEKALKEISNATKLEVADSSFLDESGKIKWPDDMGFEGNPQSKLLSKGQIVDLYGDESGFFASPIGTSYEQRALPYVQNENAHHSYEVVKSIENVKAGKISAAFNQPGGGVQYLLPDNVENLIESGYLKELY
ncbi:MAG: glycohydrolase toxin TNT-related protein [Ethanoligenens sp.]